MVLHFLSERRMKSFAERSYESVKQKMVTTDVSVLLAC